MAHLHFYGLVCSLVTTLTYGQENIVAVVNQVNMLQMEINHMKVEVPRFEARVLNKMAMLELVQRADLVEKIVPSYIQDQVEQSLKQILHEQSFDAMVQNYMYSQVKHLKQAYQAMKRQVNSINRRVRQKTLTKTVSGGDAQSERVKSEKTTYMLSISDSHGVMNSSEHSETGKLVRHLQTMMTNTWSRVRHVGQEVKSLGGQVSLLNQTCAKASLERRAIQSTVDALEAKANQTREQIGHIKKQGTMLKTCLSQMSKRHVGETGGVMAGDNPNETKVNRRRQGSSPLVIHGASTAATTVATPATTSTAIVQSPGRYVEVMTRILVVKLESFTVQNPHLIDVHNNAMQVYGYMRTSHISSVTYDSRARSLIFCRHLPKVILSSNLDSFDVKRLRKGVISLGMAVDVDRRLIFLSTFKPRRTISRMSTRGKHFRGIVDLTRHGSFNPYNIAIDTRNKMIYFCKNSDGFWSVGYDGKNLRRIQQTGSSSAVTIDSQRNIVYFSDAERVMKLSLSTNTVTEIMGLSGRIWSMCHVNNSLYVAGYVGGFIDVIYLGNNVHFNLQTMKHSKNIVLPLP